MSAIYFSRAVSLVVVTAMAYLSLGTQGVRAQGLPDFETIALSGEQVTGEDEGVLFVSFTNRTINSSGQVAFQGFLIGDLPNGFVTRTLYSNASGTLTQVARAGDQAPGANNDVLFDNFGFSSSPVLNNSGQLAFFGSLTGNGVDSSNNSGIYTENSGALAQIAREGEPAPGGSGDVFTNFENPVINDVGQTAFSAGLSGNNFGIYSEGSGVLAEVARTGDSAPGAGNGVVFSEFSIPVFNDLGQTAFLAELSGTGVDSSNRDGIYSEAFGTLTQIARTGDQVPDAASGVVFRDLEIPVLNVSGELVFEAELTGTDVEFSNRDGIYSNGSGTLEEVARTGDRVPGESDDVNFGGFLGDPVLNASGQIALNGFLVGDDVDSSSREGMYLTDLNGQLTEVVRAGSPAPTVASGITINSFNSIVLNAAGQLAFVSNLEGPNVDEEYFDNDTGIYATNQNGELIQIAREGNFFDVNNDPLVEDLRQITVVTFIGNTGNVDGRGSGFNDFGQIVFGLNFTDGTSGVFVSNLVATVPEPLLGDVNLDGTVNFFDIAPFIALLTNNGFQAEADIDQNGEVNFADILPFIGILSDS